MTDQTERKSIGSPFSISSSGWKEVVKHVKDQISENNVPIVSAGVAFFAFLAIFPAIAALVSIYGLTMDPQQVQNQLNQVSSMMPQQAYDILKTQLENVTKSSGSKLGWSTAIGLLFSLWSANKGMKSLFTAVNIAYGTQGDRGFFKQNAITLLFTLGAIILVIVSIALIVIFPAIIDQLGLPSNIESVVKWGRWILLGIIAVFFLGMIYEYAPIRPAPGFKWVLPGALLATVLWLIASWGFSFYVSNFGSYGQMYGSISAIVILLLWLFLTCFIILLGGEVNGETEKYSKRTV